jgi:2-polyprenyl-3-methyl-5-hydroxy-6-metoxy-1,4-benzoquinol methylase
MSGYYDGLNIKLLEAIPADARRVLELGCANGRLGRAFKERHPHAHWCGVDISEQATTAAGSHLDQVIHMDLDEADLSVLDGSFDVVVIGDLLEHLRHPGRLLESLYDLTVPGARIVCCLPNMSHLSVIQRLVAGDISYDEMGLLDRTHTHFYSPSSAFKVFLDAGWLPHMQDSYRVEGSPNEFAAHVVRAAEALGVPAATAVRNLGLYQMILVCEKWSLSGLHQPGPMQPFSVIVPVNRPWQHELNIARSPGLKEVGADVVCVQGATSAAAAFETGARRAKHPWRLMVHQDVYLPSGSGLAISRRLAELEQAGLHGSPVGFAGLSATSSPDPSRVAYAGVVIDRTTLFNHCASDRGVSIDEFAVALHATCKSRIDPALGWHLWGTDLCLQAMLSAGRASAQILDVPLFHNSTNDYKLPEAFYESSERLLAKYPQWSRIPTLCGEIRLRQPLSAGRDDGATRDPEVARVPDAKPASALGDPWALVQPVMGRF